MKMSQRNDFVKEESILQINKTRAKRNKKIKKIALEDVIEFVELKIFVSFSEKEKAENKKCEENEKYSESE